MESHFDVKKEHFEVTKMLIRRYESFRFINNPLFQLDSYRFSIEGDVEDFNKFYPIYEEMIRRNWNHKKDCMWLAPLNTSSYFIGGSTWGCTCGLDMFLIENELEKYDIREGTK